MSEQVRTRPIPGPHGRDEQGLWVEYPCSHRHYPEPDPEGAILWAACPTCGTRLEAR